MLACSFDSGQEAKAIRLVQFQDYQLQLKRVIYLITLPWTLFLVAGICNTGVFRTTGSG